MHGALRLWWVKLRVANYSLGKVLPFCSSSALFGKSREREAAGGGLMGGGRRLHSLGIRPVLFLGRVCSSRTLLASGPLQQPPPPKLCLLPLLILSFFSVSRHKDMFSFIWLVLFYFSHWVHMTAGCSRAYRENVSSQGVLKNLSFISISNIKKQFKKEFSSLKDKTGVILYFVIVNKSHE